LNSALGLDGGNININVLIGHSITMKHQATGHVRTFRGKDHN
jgi:hypothetical protein